MRKTVIIFCLLIGLSIPAFSYPRCQWRCYLTKEKATAALRIAAPTLIGSGIGLIFGGKKGAVAGGLIGAGSGIIYHLQKRGRKYCFCRKR